MFAEPALPFAGLRTGDGQARPKPGWRRAARAALALLSSLRRLPVAADDLDDRLLEELGGRRLPPPGRDDIHALLGRCDGQARPRGVRRR